MYITQFDEFSRGAREMFLANPLKTRYCLKYTHSKSALIIKVTDDDKCLMFKTGRASDVNKTQKLVDWMIQRCFQ